MMKRLALVALLTILVACTGGTARMSDLRLLENLGKNSFFILENAPQFYLTDDIFVCRMYEYRSAKKTIVPFLEIPERLHARFNFTLFENEVGIAVVDRTRGVLELYAGQKTDYFYIKGPRCIKAANAMGRFVSRTNIAGELYHTLHLFERPEEPGRSDDSATKTGEDSQQ